MNLERRRFLKKAAMMAGAATAGLVVGKFGLGSGVQAQSPPTGSDPTFSANGVQFPSFTVDPTALIGNMWYRSDLTAMKYSDGTNAHELAALDVANTWTGVQTFDGGIVFNAAGSLAATQTYIEADGTGGSMDLNVHSGKVFEFSVNGVGQFQMFEGGFIPNSDNSEYIATNNNRLISVSSIVFSVYHASGDAYPSFQASSGEIAFGLGGSTPLSTTLTWVSGGLQFNQIFKQYNGINTVGLGLPPIYGSGLLVSIGTTSTTIATYTPTSSTGQHFNIKWVLSAAAATTPTLTVSWTDPKAGAQSVTLFSSAMAANSVQSGVYSLVATSAAAITVSASALVAADIFGTATVSQEQ